MMPKGEPDLPFRVCLGLEGELLAICPITDLYCIGEFGGISEGERGDLVMLNKC